MQIILGILLMFSRTALGVGPMDPVVCKFNQSDPCYKALGHTLDLWIPSDYDELLFRSESSSNGIFRLRKGNINCYQHCSRWTFYNDKRTIKMTSLKREDSGRYKLETFDARGRSLAVYYITLTIEAEVSSVKVSDNCISIGKRRVSCSSEGDQLHFSWTLSGHTYNLTDENRTVLLDKNTDGSVTCHVKNHVSYGNYTVKLQPCPGTSTAAPTTSAMTTMSSNGASVQVDHTETHTLTNIQPVPNSLAVFLVVWVLEILTLSSLLGGFHLYTRIHSKKEEMEVTL